MEQIEPQTATDLYTIAKTISDAALKKVYDYFYNRIIKATKKGEFSTHCSCEPKDEDDSDDEGGPSSTEYEAIAKIKKRFIGIKAETYDDFIIFSWNKDDIEIQIEI